MSEVTQGYCTHLDMNKDTSDVTVIHWCTHCDEHIWVYAKQIDESELLANQKLAILNAVQGLDREEISNGTFGMNGTWVKLSEVLQAIRGK